MDKIKPELIKEMKLTVQLKVNLRTSVGTFWSGSEKASSFASPMTLLDVLPYVQGPFRVT